MPLVDFDELFLRADKLRNNAHVEEAVAAYLEIASLAHEQSQTILEAKAIHRAGVSAKEAVTGRETTAYRDALQYYQQALTLYKNLNDNALLGVVYRDMAIANDYAHDPATAIVNFQKSLELLESADDPGQLAITYDKLGLHLLLTGNQAGAEAHMKKALELFRQDPDAGFFRATTLYDYARVLTAKQDYSLALEQALESLSWFEADHDLEQYQRRQAQLYGLLSIIQAKLNDDKAVKHYWKLFESVTATFDPRALQVLRQDLEWLAGQI